MHEDIVNSHNEGSVGREETQLEIPNLAGRQFEE